MREPREQAVPDGQSKAEETQPEPVEREGNASPPTSLNQDIRARIARPHKGDVGREETNEEIFQGSKMKELP
jgi:hypothetical protein